MISMNLSNELKIERRKVDQKGRENIYLFMGWRKAKFGLGISSRLFRMGHGRWRGWLETLQQEGCVDDKGHGDG